MGTIGQRRRGVIYHGPHTRTSRHFTNNVAERDESRPYVATVQTKRSFFGQQKAVGPISCTLRGKVNAFTGQSQCYWMTNSLLLQLLKRQGETYIQQPRDEGILRCSK